MYLNSTVGVVADDIFNFAVGDQIFTRIIEAGKYRASWAVKNPVSSQTLAMQTVLNDPSVSELLVNIPVLLSGTLTVPVGKKISFEGDGKFTGTATINGGVFPRLRPVTHYVGTVVIVPEEIWDNKDIFTITGNSTREVLATRYVKRIVVKPVSNLAGFQLGLSPGGSELISSQPLTGGVSQPLNVDYYAEVTTLLYFVGITSSTQIILYYE
jgi:hypothetical protein